MSDQWFHYPVRVQPHHTDYAGVVWHGSFIAWMEEARIEFLHSHSMNYADWVEMGYELPVVDLSLRYHRFLAMGQRAIVKTRVAAFTGVRLNWDYRIEATDQNELYVTAQVTLVVVDRKTGKIVRRLPDAIEAGIKALIG